MLTSRRRKAGALIIPAAAAFGIAQLLFWLSPGLFETWNSQVLDRFFLIRSSVSGFNPPYDRTVVHVDLNNSAIRQLGTFYLTRSHYARVIQNLAAMQTSAQAYDLIFAAETNPADDEAIIEAARAARNVYFGMALALGSEGDPKEARVSGEVNEYLGRTLWSVCVEGKGEDLYRGSKPLITFPGLAAASRGLGFLTLQADRDGVLRRVPLLVRYEDGYYPSLPFRVACDFLGVPPEKITITPGSHIRLEGARRPGGTPRDILIPIDRHANMIVNFTGPWGSMKHYNFAQIYSASDDREEMELWIEELSGKVAVISDISTGASDIGPVPVDVNFPLSGLHANVVHTIISESFLSEWPRVSPAVEAAMVLVLLLMSTRLSPARFFAGAALFMAVCAAGALALFLTGGVMLPVVRPAFASGTAAAFILAWRYFQDEKEKEVLRRSFESYFPPTVVKRILANPALIERGQRKELTVLFSDIKDFTFHSSAYSPSQIRAFLNEYFETMVEVVFTYEGTVDKYIGDGLMVFFGDPEPLPDHAVRAVKAAMAMQAKARELSEKWKEKGGFPVRIRIGISTGEVVVGNMGSSRRLSYTVLGSAVNLAKRLESNAPVNGILVSRRTFELIDGIVPARSFGKTKVKGFEEPVSTYEVIPGNGIEVVTSEQ